jgi:hypothetical protein
MKFPATKAIVYGMLLTTLLTGCSSTKQAKYNGMSTAEGPALAHLSTSNLAIHLLVGKSPLVGNASLAQTMDDFTAQAKELGATKVRVVQSNERAWWFVFFPFSLLFTPVSSNVAGDALQ